MNDVTENLERLAADMTMIATLLKRVSTDSLLLRVIPEAARQCGVAAHFASSVAEQLSAAIEAGRTIGRRERPPGN